MTVMTAEGDYHISELSDEQLIRERNYWNERLEPSFYADSGVYDAAARMLSEIESEINRREHEGPPWSVD